MKAEVNISWWWLVDAYNPMDKLRSLRRRSFKEILVYIAVNTLLIAAVLAMFAAGLSWDSFVRWFALVVFTLMPFGYFLSDSRALWKKRNFWEFVVVCLAVHLAAWIATLTRVHDLKAIWFAAAFVELVALLFLRNRLFPNSHERC